MENTGITYYKNLNIYEGDVTKNGTLDGKEVDANFHFLRGNDIKTFKINEENKLVLERINGETIILEIPLTITLSGTSFDSETGALTLCINGTELILTGITSNSNIDNTQNINETLTKLNSVIECLEEDNKSYSTDIDALFDDIDAIKTTLDAHDDDLSTNIVLLNCLRSADDRLKRELDGAKEELNNKINTVVSKSDEAHKFIYDLCQKLQNGINTLKIELSKYAIKTIVDDKLNELNSLISTCAKDSDVKAKLMAIRDDIKNHYVTIIDVNAKILGVYNTINSVSAATNCKVESVAASINKRIEDFKKSNNEAHKTFVGKDYLDKKISDIYTRITKETSVYINEIKISITKLEESFTKKVNELQTSIESNKTNLQTSIENKSTQDRQFALDNIMSLKNVIEADLKNIKTTLGFVSDQLGIVKDGDTLEYVQELHTNVAKLLEDTAALSAITIQQNSEIENLKTNLSAETSDRVSANDTINESITKLDDDIHKTINLVNNVLDSKLAVGIRRDGDKLVLIYQDNTTSEINDSPDISDFIKSNLIDVEGGVVSYSKYEALLKKVGELTGIHSIDTFYGDAFYRNDLDELLFLNKHIADVIDEHSFMFEINAGSYIRVALPKKYILSSLYNTAFPMDKVECKLVSTYTKNGTIYNVWESEEQDFGAENIYTATFTEE